MHIVVLYACIFNVLKWHFHQHWALQLIRITVGTSGVLLLTAFNLMVAILSLCLASCLCKLTF